MSVFPGISEKQSRAIIALITAPTRTAAARMAGCHERTIARWLTEPEFQRALDYELHAMRSDIATTMTQAAAEAVAVLREQLASGTASEKLAAARAILGSYSKHLSAGEVRATHRIDEIERRSFAEAEYSVQLNASRIT